MDPITYDISPSYWWGIVSEVVRSGKPVQEGIDAANTALAAYRFSYTPVTVDNRPGPVAPSH